MCASVPPDSRMRMDLGRMPPSHFVLCETVVLFPNSPG